jgi:WD40 repeat protein
MYDFASITSAHEGAVEDLAFDPDHQRIASAGNGYLMIWGVDQNGEHIFTFSLRC